MMTVDSVCEETKPLVGDEENREMDVQEPDLTDEQDTVKADDLVRKLESCFSSGCTLKCSLHLQDESMDDIESIVSEKADAHSVGGEECGNCVKLMRSYVVSSNYEGTF